MKTLEERLAALDTYVEAKKRADEQEKIREATLKKEALVRFESLQKRMTDVIALGREVKKNGLFEKCDKKALFAYPTFHDYNQHKFGFLDKTNDNGDGVLCIGRYDGVLSKFSGFDGKSLINMAINSETVNEFCDRFEEFEHKFLGWFDWAVCEDERPIPCSGYEVRTSQVEAVDDDCIKHLRNISILWTQDDIVEILEEAGQPVTDANIRYVCSEIGGAMNESVISCVHDQLFNVAAYGDVPDNNRFGRKEGE